MAIQPVTQKVPARRGGALTVGLAALVIVGILVARPWESAKPVAAPSAQPSLPVLGVAPTPTIPATPEPLVLPTPDVAPLGPIGDMSLDTAPDSAMAHCLYGSPRRGARRLASVEVQPPVVLLDAGSSVTDIKRIGWWFELEMNTEDNVFDRDWETVGRSRDQAVAASQGRPARFTPLTMPLTHRDLPRTSIFRVRVVVEWYTRNVELAGRAEIVANRYQEGDNELIGSWPLYCRGLRPA